jgi:hypothetical protein
MGAFLGTLACNSCKSDLLIPQHVWDNEVSHMAAANVDLFEMGDAAVARGHCDVLELNVHVILRCTWISIATRVGNQGNRRTFEELSAVDLARSDLDGNDMPLHAVSAAKSPGGYHRHTAASLRSLIGIPIVLVILLA